MSKTTIPDSPLSEEQEKQIVAAVVTQKQRDAFVAAVGAAIGAQTESEAKRLKKLAADAVKAAKERGVEGPFLPDAEKESIYNGHAQQLHSTLFEQTFRHDAGEEDADPDRFVELVRKLSELDWQKLV